MAVETLDGFAAPFEDEGARVRYLQGEHRRNAYAALARRLMRRHARDPDPGHDRGAPAVLWRAGFP